MRRMPQTNPLLAFYSVKNRGRYCECACLFRDRGRNGYFSADYFFKEESGWTGCGGTGWDLDLAHSYGWSVRRILRSSRAKRVRFVTQKKLIDGFRKEAGILNSNDK